jgi:cation transport ATPase
MPSADTRLVCRYERESDRIQQIFRRPFFLSLTIGIPFCVFKLLFGLTLLRISLAEYPSLSFLGWLVILWAGVDLLMNLGRVGLDLAHRPALFEYCTIAQLGRAAGRPLVFLAVDTLVSFSIISYMLWSEWITLLSTNELYLWYGATTLNLISLSLVLLYNEIRNARPA